MPIDPVEEWRRLSALYSEMGDIEIEELANQINDLTPTAQDVLRDELKKRGLSNSAEVPLPSTLTGDAPRKANLNWEPASYRNQFGSVPDEDQQPHHYTWKAPLVDCETTIEARRIGTMLQRAGIDSWIERPGGRLGLSGPRILVGADQLDEAQLIAAQPVPQDILQEEKDLESATEYELPTCPKCGAPDPTLESVEPSNNWLCESCDHTWSDPVTEDSSQGGTAAGG